MLIPALVGLIGCGLAGAGVGWAIRRIPEPPPPSDPVEGEPPKVPYADLGARRSAADLGAAGSGLIGASLGAAYGWDWVLVLWWPLVPVGVLLAYVDAHTRLLPRLVVLPATGYALAIGLLHAVLTPEYDALLRAVVGLLAVRTFFWLLWFIRRAGMGFGDVRLSALLGFGLAWLGWAELVIGLYAAFLAFAVPYLLLAVLRRDRSVMKTAYPFGPFLLLGAWFGLVFGASVSTGLGY
jgi:leader peptidase (prepilin peptidase)/N-methyltransferase